METLATRIVAQGSQYFLATLLILWIVVGFTFAFDLRKKRRHIASTLGTGLLVSFAWAFLVFQTVPLGFRVLSDEANIVAVSKSMSESGKAVNRVMQFSPGNGSGTTAVDVYEKRPLLFPFLASLVHRLR